MDLFRKLIFFGILFMSLLFVHETIAAPCENGGCVDILRAIEIANGSIGLSPEESRALEISSAKRFLTPRNDLVPDNAIGLYWKALTSKLEGRVYWIIYYQPRVMQFGGDIAVFIDAETQEVIHIYRGE